MKNAIKGGILCSEQLLEILSVLFTNGTISKTKDFPLFRKDCFFTDDTVMTCAVAEAIMNGGQKDDFIDANEEIW